MGFNSAFKGLKSHNRLLILGFASSLNLISTVVSFSVNHSVSAT